jgi:hypothetical protein
MSKRALLNEEVTRRMMKLANIGAVNAENFMTEAYEELKESNASPVNEEEELEEDKAYTAKKEKPGAEGTLAKTKTPGEGEVAFVKEGEDVYQEEEGDESMGDPSETHPGELDYEGDMEADLAADEEAAMDVGEGSKEEKFKTIVDMLADLLDVEADVELEGGEELEPMPGEEEEAALAPSPEVEAEEEVDIMESLVNRVMTRIEERKQQTTQKEQVAEQVADRIMKRLEV